MLGDVTQLLNAIDSGDSKAAEELLPLVYEELRRLAAHKMAREKAGQTLQATALVHEAWLRLSGSTNQQWRGREHFSALPPRRCVAS
jgi:DNA-directed RNA polymerase specialized sigma24 family protein